MTSKCRAVFWAPCIILNWNDLTSLRNLHLFLSSEILSEWSGQYIGQFALHRNVLDKKMRYKRLLSTLSWQWEHFRCSSNVISSVWIRNISRLPNVLYNVHIKYQSLIVVIINVLSYGKNYTLFLNKIIPFTLWWTNVQLKAPTCWPQCQGFYRESRCTTNSMEAILPFLGAF